MSEPAHKTQLTSTVYATPLMTPTTALGLSIRLSMFELRETGDCFNEPEFFPWDLRLEFSNTINPMRILDVVVVVSLLFRLNPWARACEPRMYLDHEGNRKGDESPS